MSIKNGIIFTLSVLLCALSTHSSGSDSQINWTPPSFSLADVSGVSFRYPEDIERPTIVLFWATWCPYCRALMPHLQSILDEYGGQVEVIALNIREDEDPVEYLDRFGFQFRLFPEADETGNAWGIKGTPGLFLANAAGEVVFSRGAIPREAFRLTEEEAKVLKNAQKAARVAPLWAARMRVALDALLITP